MGSLLSLLPPPYLLRFQKECAENKIKYLFFHKPPPKIAPSSPFYSHRNITKCFIIWTFSPSFSHTLLLNRTEIPKTAHKKKLLINNTHRKNFCLLFIPHKFNEKKEKLKEEKGKVENHPKVFLAFFFMLYMLAFYRAGRCSLCINFICACITSYLYFLFCPL